DPHTGSQREAAVTTALAAELSRDHAGLEFPVLPARYFRAGPEQEPRVESRRLSGQGRRALRRMPHTQECIRREQAWTALRRRPGRELVCATPRQCAAQRTAIMERR